MKNLRILLVHAHYKQKGGEDAVFLREAQLLSKYNEVRTLDFYNGSGIKSIIKFALSIWNIFAYWRLKSEIRGFKPDVIHFHNLHFAAGPILIRCAYRMRIPIVCTLHNFRLICPSAILLHDGKLFLDSIHSDFPWKAVRMGVYRNSILQTFWLAATVWLHRHLGTWKMVDHYFLFSPFAKTVFQKSIFDVPSNRFVVKPNFVAAHTRGPASRGSHFLFIGRLTEEKGILDVLNAFSRNSEKIVIAGDGPLRGLVENVANHSDRITYLGPVDGGRVVEEMSNCSALIFSSKCFEGMPLALIESLSVGTPVISTNIGVMPDIVQHEYNGLLFEPSNPDSLNRQLSRWSGLDHVDKAIYYENAAKSFEEKYTEEISLDILTRIYNSTHETVSRSRFSLSPLA